MAGDFSNKTLQTPTLKFEPVILDDQRRRRSINGRDSDDFRCGLCFSDRGKPALRGTIDCCDHTFCFVCIVRWAKAESFCPRCKLRFTTIYGPSKNAVFASKRPLNPPEGNQACNVLRAATSGPLIPCEDIRCSVCHGTANESRCRLLCDICDSAVHTYCVGFHAATVLDSTWFCYNCALSRSSHDKTEVHTAVGNQKTSRNFDGKLPVEKSTLVFGTPRNSIVPVSGDHNSRFSSRPNYWSPPILPAGRRSMHKADGPVERSHHRLSSASLCGKRSGKGSTKARVAELEKLVQSLLKQIKDEQQKRERIERGIHDRIKQQIDEKFQQHFDQFLAMHMNQILLEVHSAKWSSKPPV
ncbi:Zinc finger, PHD-type [Corchorus olitorius]|uniref:Zinc finger, PHD-type n=1 Tax=Corchorus olitorius TaxID=93759 RepID=A0A1R3HI04_9ROSI|nr:Zinc finger, PHD-type [Corchorus olitorius]